MPSAAIQWDQASLQEMDYTIRREIAVTGKEAKECVKHAFLVFGISGRAGTKLSETKRQVFENPNRKNPNTRLSGGSRPAKYFIQFLYQSKPPRLAPAHRKSDPRRRISRRGLARASWGWMMQKVWSDKVTPNPYGIAKYKVMAVVDGTKAGTNPFIDFHDKLVYLLKVHPNIGNASMAKAANRMNAVMDKRMTLEMQRVWHS